MRPSGCSFPAGPWSGWLAAGLAAGLVTGCGLLKLTPKATDTAQAAQAAQTANDAAAKSADAAQAASAAAAQAAQAADAAKAAAAPSADKPSFLARLFGSAAPPPAGAPAPAAAAAPPENPSLFPALFGKKPAPANPPAPAGTTPAPAESPSLFPSLALDSKQPVVPPADKLQTVLDKTDWEYAANALTLDVDSDPGLNTFGSEAHSLVLAVVQAADAGSFHQLLATPGQFSQVLQGAAPASGLLAIDRYAIEPGQRVRIVTDRMQGARFVGFVAAYYGVSPAATSRLFSVPVRYTKSGVILKDYRATPVPALLRVRLGTAVVLGATLEPSEPVAPVPGAGAVPTPTTAAAIPLGATAAPLQGPP